MNQTVQGIIKSRQNFRNKEHSCVIEAIPSSLAIDNQQNLVSSESLTDRVNIV